MVFLRGGGQLDRLFRHLKSLDHQGRHLANAIVYYMQQSERMNQICLSPSARRTDVIVVNLAKTPKLFTRLRNCLRLKLVSEAIIA